MNSKIRIKLGAIEVDYEGTETFLKEELPSFLRTVSDLYQNSKEIVSNEGIETNLPLRAAETSSVKIEMTTSAIATKLSVSSGSQLLLAAAAHLRIVKGFEKFERKLLSEQMRSASSFFKESYIKNLSKSIKTLMREAKLNEPSNGVYALTHIAEQELRNRLA